MSSFLTATPAKAAGFIVLTLFSAFFILFPDNSIQDQIAHFASVEFNTTFQILAHLLLFYTAWRWRSWRPVLLDLAVSLPLNITLQLVKHFFTADFAIRPSGGYGGFPSGHASATFSLAFLLSIYYPRLWTVWYVAAGLVTWSRVQTNAHTELQIAAGMIFGSILAYICVIWLIPEKNEKQGDGSSAS